MGKEDKLTREARQILNRASALAAELGHGHAGTEHVLLALGEEAMDRMETLGDVLLPAVSMATAAGGSPGAAAWLQTEKPRFYSDTAESAATE